MEWGIIALGWLFVAYLIYCFIKDWLALRRFNRIRRKSRETAAAERNDTGNTGQPHLIHTTSSLLCAPVEAAPGRMKKAAYRIVIVEEQGGWWAGQIWNADDQLVYQGHRRSEEEARDHALEKLAHFGSSITPEVTTKYLRSD
jgi:hypothetical protein